jgi:hypothetical protein
MPVSRASNIADIALIAGLTGSESIYPVSFGGREPVIIWIDSAP